MPYAKKIYYERKVELQNLLAEKKKEENLNY
jgi:hypothetical protein